MRAEFFSGVDEHGCVDGVALSTLADEFGTPLYVYRAAAMRAALRAYHAHGLEQQVALYYAVKANSNLALLRLFTEAGTGFDIVSGGELERVLRAGGVPSSVVFSGVAKSDAEISRALAVGIGCFNVESPAELRRLAELAASAGVIAPVALRVNPDVDAGTHPYISTGLRGNKFGVAIADAPALYREALQLPPLKVVGVGCHIGSQIHAIAPFLAAMDSLLPLVDAPEVPSAADLSRALLSRLGDRPLRLCLQPGRSLVGNAGLLLSRVVFTKAQSERRFLMLDAAMNDYIRPALYQVRPTMLNVSRPYDGAGLMDVVGPVCETGDTFARDFPISGERGDLVAICGTGAYGFSMASSYNSRPRPAEVLIEDGKARLIRRRESLEDLWAQEVL